MADWCNGSTPGSLPGDSVRVGTRNGHEGVPSRGMTDFDRTHPNFYSIRTQILLISRGEIMSKIYKITNDINNKVYVGKLLVLWKNVLLSIAQIEKEWVLKIVLFIEQ